MATTGETIWASLIARQKIRVTPISEVRNAYLTFSFGPWVHYRTEPVPISELKLHACEFRAPYGIRPGVYIHFRYWRRAGSLRGEEKFRLTWPYRYRQMSHRDISFLCVFQEPRNNLLVQIDGSSLAPYTGKRLLNLIPKRTKRSKGRPSVTPLQLFNLSLIAGVLAPRGSIPRKPFVRKRRGPYQRKPLSPRPNPEVKTSSFTLASESLGVPYFATSESKELFRREWTGVNTPNFARKSGRELPDNPYTLSLTRTEWSMGYDLRKKKPGFGTTYTNAWNCSAYPFVAPTMLGSDTDFTMVENKALMKLNERANLGVQANMAQNIAQYSQTTNMIANTAKRLVGSITALKRGKFALAGEYLFESRSGKGLMTSMKGLSRSKSLASNWLELQYGWKPLLSDVDASMRILADYLTKARNFQEVRGSAFVGKETSYPKFGPLATTPHVGHEYDRRLYSVRFGVRYKVDSPTYNLLSQFGFTNPINLAWEILPYSFVVDWFLPIGPYLESMSAPHGLEFISGFKTRFGRQNTTTDVSFNGTMPGDSTADLQVFMWRDRERVTFVRSKLSAYPTQKFPQFKNPFSTVHAANAIALLRQAFRKT